MRVQSQDRVIYVRNLRALNFIHATRYMLAYHMPHAEHVESSIGRMAKHSRDKAMLPSAYSVHGSASKVNRTSRLLPPLSCRLSSFVEQLTSRLLCQL